MVADLVLRDAAVYTGRGFQSGAVAVEAGRIVQVGALERMRHLLGARTQTIDCRGGLLSPGFIDAHVHPITGGLKLLRCSLYEAANAREALDAIAAYVRTHPGEDWVWGGGWSLDWFERGTPPASMLDQVVADRPVFLYNRDGHGAWLNSEGLRRAGIDANTPDPPDGRIERLADGSPQGTVHEGAMDLVESLIPPPREREWDLAMRAGRDYLLGFGITGWQDADVQPAHDRAYVDAAQRGELTASVVGALWWERHRGLEQIEELMSRRAVMAPGYRPTAVKLMLDGVAENYTAAMLDPYLDGAGNVTTNSGLDFIDPTDLQVIVPRLDRLGFQCHFHAIGDRAVRSALDAVARARAENGSGGPLHHIAHVQVIDPTDVPRFAELGVAANVQALWACAESQMVDLTLPFLGPTQREHQYPFASLLQSGALVGMGSDWSVSTPNVMKQIEVAVTRRSPDQPGAPAFMPEEALTLDQALTAFTTGSARINQVDDRRGTIAEGMDADLVVFDRNPFVDEPIGAAEVRYTIAQGRVAYEAPT
jgi:predicted amidohydrolase YtcJ